MAEVHTTPQTILVADDSDDDVFFIRRAIRDACGKEVVVVRDGEHCIDYLSSNAHPIPDLIILDIKMPRADGHEVLAWLRAQPKFKHIPVVVLSGSLHPADRTRSLSAGAKAYFPKSAELASTVQILEHCNRQWAGWRGAQATPGS